MSKFRQSVGTRSQLKKIGVDDGDRNWRRVAGGAGGGPGPRRARRSVGADALGPSHIPGGARRGKLSMTGHPLKQRAAVDGIAHLRSLASVQAKDIGWGCFVVASNRQHDNARRSITIQRAV